MTGINTSSCEDSDSSNHWLSHDMGGNYMRYRRGPSRFGSPTIVYSKWWLELLSVGEECNSGSLEQQWEEWQTYCKQAATTKASSVAKAAHCRLVSSPSVQLESNLEWNMRCIHVNGGRRLVTFSHNLFAQHDCQVLTKPTRVQIESNSNHF